MYKISVLISLVILGLLGPVSFWRVEQKAGAAEGKSVLERQVEGSDLEYVSTTQAVSKALYQAGAPGGIIRVSGCGGEVVIHKWQPSGSSLRDVLDSIEKADPQYHWSIAGEVINALPAAGEPELLKTRISEFKLKKVVSPDAALSKLIAMPEVTVSVNRLGLNEALKAGSFPISNQARTEHDVSCSNVTLREALNIIARAFGNAVWFYKEDHCNGKDEYSIDFIVE